MAQYSLERGFVVRLALFLGLAAHIAIAVWNGFFGPSLGAEGDAVNFHNEAVYYAYNLGNFEYVTGWIYSYILGIFYRIFTDHIFFGSMISVAAWFTSCIVLIKTMRTLNQNDYRIAVSLLIFSLWPSALLNTSVTLRESFETLGISFVIYGSIISFWQKNNGWLLIFFGMAMISVLHGALLAFSGIMLLFLFYYVGTYRLQLGWPVKIIFMTVPGVAVILAGFLLLNNIAYNLDNGLLGAVESYNEGAISINARADYRTTADLSESLNILLFFPAAFLQYMIEPIPSRIGNIQDAIAFLENIFRLGLLLTALIVNRKIPYSVRAPHSFILFAFISLSFIWSVGTVNWGTASRHQAPGLMLVVVAALFQSRFHAVAKTKKPQAMQAPFATSEV
jgi:hypothetical protein